MTADMAALLLDKERRILEAQRRHEDMSHRQEALEAELLALNGEVDAIARRLRALGRDRVEFGDLRRLTPISPVWGLDRGMPLDRYYIDAFLDRHRHDIRGRVLEVKDGGYTRVFGDGRVTRSDVLDVDPRNTNATVMADLSRADAIPDDTYDCFILTQTLGAIYDVAEAVGHAVRVLKQGGVLLCTLPAAGRISYEEGLDGDFWRFTEGSVRRLFGDALPEDAFEVAGHGNVLACAAFLYGLAPHELTREELDVVDPYFPLVYTVRAVKPQAAAKPPGISGRSAVAGRAGSSPVATVLTYHRIADPAHDRDHLCVPVEDFRGHMRHLQDAGYRVLPLDELVAAATAGSLEGPSVGLTFDDGYVDALADAAPILESFGFPATFFIVGEALDGPHEFWWDALDRIFLSEHRLPDRLVLPLAGEPLDVSTASRAERAAVRDRLRQAFYGIGWQAGKTGLQALNTWSGTQPPTGGPRRPMIAHEVVRLASKPGFSIGAHSQHHLQLPLLPAAERSQEIRACRTTLEALVGRRVTAFSYPYGYVDAPTVEAVRAEGFDVAVTTEGRALKRPVDALRVPRIDAAVMGVSAFAQLLESLAR